MTHSASQVDEAPLFSSGFVWKLTIGIAVLCLLTLAISLLGRQFGRSMIMAGHTADRTPLHIVIGDDVLELPANVIRFESARQDGAQEAIETYFVWPEMSGYSEDRSDLFNQIEGSSSNQSGLIFARASQATMSQDMSGRYKPIYTRLVEGTPVPGPGGLVSYRMRPGAGYASELLYVDPAGGDKPYAIRCLIEAQASNAMSTATGCQRDIALGAGLSVTYRFSIDLLPHWRQIETDVRDRFAQALGTNG